MTESILTKKQVKTFTKVLPPSAFDTNNSVTFTVKVRYDDECNNGHNTFAITGEMTENGRRDCFMCGCVHDEIKKHFPKLAHLIQWHLVTSDGPIHYVANTLYYARGLGRTVKFKDVEPNLEAARSCACWPDATLEQLQDKELLEARLPDLMSQFREVIEAFGFVY